MSDADVFNGVGNEPCEDEKPGTTVEEGLGFNGF